MDPLQEHLTRVGLEAIGRRGFVLGGGHAIEMHGMGARPSEDIELFTTQRGNPDAVADDLIGSYQRAGLTLEVQLRTADLVQMEVTDPCGPRCKVDLGVFWQAHSPVLLEIGPVLHPDDAVAGKMDALFNRWPPRDFLDVHAILASGRYDRHQLMSVAAEHNPGFSSELFAESLSYLRPIPDREFIAHGADQERIGSMRHEFSTWGVRTAG
jgi:hypothetical protein